MSAFGAKADMLFATVSALVFSVGKGSGSRISALGNDSTSGTLNVTELS